MKLGIILTAVAAAALIFTAAASAGTIDTIEEVEQTALLNNLDYKTAVLEVMKAENAIEGYLKLDSSSLSLSGSYGQQGTGTADEAALSDFGWQASANLPLFEQLSLSAAVEGNLDSSFSINLKPLAHSSSVEDSEQNLSLKLAAAEEKARETADSAVQNYLEWSSAAADYEIKNDIAAVKKVLYEDEKIRFEAGESTLDDVRDTFTEWSESRTALNEALNKYQSAEAGLYEILNVDPADIDIIPPDEAGLFNLTESLAADLADSRFSITGSYAVLEAENSTGSIERQLKNTWLFDPELSISGSMALDAVNLQPSFSATASLSVGIDDWKADERQELAAELEISRAQAVQAVSSEELKLEQLRLSAETASINYALAEVESEQAEELLDEAEFLYGLGEYSEAELEESMLQYKQSKNSLFTAAADHYTALRALAAYAL